MSVIGNDPAALETYGPGEIVSGNEFYDYAAKYTPGLSETSTRAEVTTRQRALLHKLSRDVYRAIGAEGFARIDFLVAGERIVVSEINTIPGFTPISLFPTMAADGGYDLRSTSVGGSSSSPCERHARAAGGRASAGRPAPMTQRPGGPPHAPPARPAGRRPRGVGHVGPPHADRSDARRPG